MDPRFSKVYKRIKTSIEWISKLLKFIPQFISQFLQNYSQRFVKICKSWKSSSSAFIDLFLFSKHNEKLYRDSFVWCRETEVRFLFAKNHYFNIYIKEHEDQRNIWCCLMWHFNVSYSSEWIRKLSNCETSIRE